jgi:hypothetical protein
MFQLFSNYPFPELPIGLDPDVVHGLIGLGLAFGDNAFKLG